MENKLKYRKETKTETISEPVDILLDEALAEIDKFPTVDEDEGGWLEFIFGDSDVQLIRLTNDLWYVDIPVVENGKLLRSLSAESATEKVKESLEKFAQGQDPTTLFDDLQVIYHTQTDDKEIIPRDQRSFAIRDEYMKDTTCDCGSTNFDAERASKEMIMLKCSRCQKQYSLEVGISEEKDNVEPVITLLPIE